MDAPWIPPYFGSYEELVNALLGNPFLGSGAGPGHPLRAEAFSVDPERVGRPQPFPWLGAKPEPFPWLGAAGYLVSVLGLREAAANAGEAGAEIVRGADQAIDQFIDGYCGTTWHVPWPVPGPGPWVFGLASQLSLIGNTLQQGELRSAVLGLAGRIIRHGVAKASPGG
jgi:hypothetical protein